MKKKRRWFLIFLVLLGVAVMGGVPILESKDALSWRRFKRHMGYAVKWGSWDQAVAAVSAPKTRRIAAVAPYNGKLLILLIESGPGWNRPYIYEGDAKWLVPPGSADPVELTGDVEWEVAASPGSYRYILKAEGALSSFGTLYWNGKDDIDLGRLKPTYGDLDGDNQITAKEADLAESLVGEAVAPPGKNDLVPFTWTQRMLEHHADIDHDGLVEEWEAETIRANVGKRGSGRQSGFGWL